MPRVPWELVIRMGPGVRLSVQVCCLAREETEIIEGEVVEIQIDRPATGTVSPPWATPRAGGLGVRAAQRSDIHSSTCTLALLRSYGSGSFE